MHHLLRASAFLGSQSPIEFCEGTAAPAAERIPLVKLVFGLAYLRTRCYCISSEQTVKQMAARWLLKTGSVWDDIRCASGYDTSSSVRLRVAL